MVNALIARMKMRYSTGMASLKVGTGKSPDGSSDFEAPEGLVAVAGFDCFQVAGDSGLAILAMGYPYWTFLHEGRYLLCVAAGQAAAVQHELQALHRLQTAARSTQALRYSEFAVRPYSFILYLLLLTAAFIAQQLFDLLPFGSADAQLMVAGGQWWRAVTALTLHGDVVHLVSNLVAGLGFAFFVARFWGAASGWFLILLSGGLGNALNAWVYYPESHVSIGASTAVFGALGLLSGVGVWMALADPLATRGSRPRWLIPLFAGLTLLGLLGVGDGVRIDVAAHISGFACGVGLGLLAAVYQRFFVRLEPYAFWLGCGGILLVAGAWAMAVTAI
jgi:rhomboid protease GluP